MFVWFVLFEAGSSELTYSYLHDELESRLEKNNKRKWSLDEAIFAMLSGRASVAMTWNGVWMKARVRCASNSL